MSQRQYNFIHTFYRSWNSSVDVVTGLKKWSDSIVGRRRNYCLLVFVPQISYIITGNGAVSPDLHKLYTETIHSPQIVTTLWIRGAVSPVLHTNSWIANTWFPHSPTIYSLYITHVCLYKYVCVCLYLMYILISPSCTHLHTFSTLWSVKRLLFSSQLGGAYIWS